MGLCRGTAAWETFRRLPGSAVGIVKDGRAVGRADVRALKRLVAGPRSPEGRVDFLTEAGKVAV